MIHIFHHTCFQWKLLLSSSVISSNKMGPHNLINKSQQTNISGHVMETHADVFTWNDFAACAHPLPTGCFSLTLNFLMLPLILPVCLQTSLLNIFAYSEMHHCSLFLRLCGCVFVCFWATVSSKQGLQLFLLEWKFSWKFSNWTWTELQTGQLFVTNVLRIYFTSYPILNVKVGFSSCRMAPFYNVTLWILYYCFIIGGVLTSKQHLITR